VLPNCKDLKRKIYSETEQFKEVPRTNVLLYVDSPRKKERPPLPMKNETKQGIANTMNKTGHFPLIKFCKVPKKKK